MSESSSKGVSQDDLLSPFWQSYQDVAISQKISSAHLKWYLIWAQRFAKAFKGVPLKERTPEHRSAFIDNLRNDPFNLGNWNRRMMRYASCVATSFNLAGQILGRKQRCYQSRMMFHLFFRRRQR